MMRLISSCGTAWWPGVLPTSMTSTVSGRSSSRLGGPEPVGDHDVGLATARAGRGWSRGRQRRVRHRPARPVPAPPSRAGCAGPPAPAGGCAASRSRTVTVRAGSGCPVEATPTTSPACRREAGVRAVPSWHGAGTHAEHAARGGPPAYRGVGARVAGRGVRRATHRRSPRAAPSRSTQVTSPAATRSRRSSQSAGETTVTTAPSATSGATRRAATGPPPATSTARPASSSPSKGGHEARCAGSGSRPTKTTSSRTRTG